MPTFKKNTSPAMKRSGFKMGGYSYPGVSPVKQETGSIDFWNQPSRQSDIIHKAEKGIGKSKEVISKTVKKVKGKTVKISKKDVLSQMKKAGSKLKYSDVKKALKTSIKAAGKVAKFVPGVAGLVLSATKTATADQPKLKKGDTHYRDPKKSIF